MPCPLTPHARVRHRITLCDRSLSICHPECSEGSQLPMKHPAKKSISRRIRRAEASAPSAPLLTASELKSIAERIMKFSEADETEVEIEVTTDALTRFANNIIHQNVAEQVLHISVRAVMDGRTARATTNKTDEESLRRVMAAA